MTSERIQLGSGVWYTKLQWRPNRDLNPHYEHLHDDEWCGLIISHLHPDGSECSGSVTFATPSQVAVNALNVAKGYKERPMWQVESWEPLTLSPSVHNTDCGLHGFVRNGMWVPA